MSSVLKVDQIQSDTGTVNISSNVVFSSGLTAGSAAAPSIFPTGDTNTGIFFPAADQLGIATNGVERVKLGNSETVFNDGGADVDFRVEGDTNANLLFVDASTDRVGINKSSPDTKLNIGFAGPDAVNTFRIEGSNGSSERYALDIVADGGNGVAKFMIGQGGGAPAERARMTPQGYFKATSDGTYANISGTYHELRASTTNEWILIADQTTASNPYGLLVRYRSASPNDTTKQFLYCEDSTTKRVEFRSNGGLANYSGNNANLSDRREKTNFALAKNYLDTICAIPVQTFNYIDQNLEDDPGLTLGVVAQDVQEVAPELVMESNWAGKDEEPKMRLSIYQTDLQYALMKSIQELKAITDTQAQTISALEARIEALESQ